MEKKRKTWRRAEEGVVAVEVAMLALPFFLLLLGIIETALFFASGAVLEGASASAARLIRTGQVQTSDNPETAFRDELCDHIGLMMDCNDVQYEVIHVDENSFAPAQDQAPEFDDEGNLIPQGFNTGNSNDVVLVRAVYKYEFMTPYLAGLMTGDTDKNWLLHMATVVLKAEPYDFGED